jgi:hypothetical protein
LQAGKREWNHGAVIGHFLSALRAPTVVVALVCVAAVPAATQTTRTDTPKGTRAWTPSLTPDGQPDLQGVWSDVSITPLERPLALQGRQFLTDQEVSQLKARADRLFSNAASDFVGGDSLFLALLANAETVENPNATGSALNMVFREFDNRTSLIIDPQDGRLPALTPEGRRRVTANQVATLALPWQFDQSASAQPRELPPGRPRPNSAEDLSTLLRCISWGVPKIAGNANYTSHYEIFQGPGYVVFLSEVNHEARVIPLDGRPHLSQSIRQWNGDSRGRWEGNTLVVETTNFAPKSYFMGSADRLHLVERFTRMSEDRIDYAVTIDDPTTWTRPWTAVVRLRSAHDDLHEFACHEGNHHVVRGILGGARAEEQSPPN